MHTLLLNVTCKTHIKCRMNLFRVYLRNQSEAVARSVRDQVLSLYSDTYCFSVDQSKNNVIKALLHILEHLILLKRNVAWSLCRTIPTVMIAFHAIHTNSSLCAKFDYEHEVISFYHVLYQYTVKFVCTVD